MSFRASPPSSRSPSPGSSCSDDDDEILRVIRAEIARDDASRRARHQSASASATVVQRGRAPLAASRVQPARRAPAPPRVPMVPPVRDAGRSSNSTSGTLPPIVTSSSRTSSSRTSSSTIPSSAPRGPPPAPSSHASSTAALAELEAALADDAAFRALVRGPPLSGSRRRVAPRLKRRRRVGTARTSRENITRADEGGRVGEEFRRARRD